jgi:hypothetical protein
MTHYDEQYDEEIRTREQAMNEEWEAYVESATLEQQQKLAEDRDDNVTFLVNDKPVQPPKPVHNKYAREVPKHLTHLDVYDVLKIFDVVDPAVQHAVKKLLCTGSRGHKCYQEDLEDALHSIERALELNEY